MRNRTTEVNRKTSGLNNLKSKQLSGMNQASLAYSMMGAVAEQKLQAEKEKPTEEMIKKDQERKAARAKQ